MQTCEQEAKRLGLLWDGYERNAAVNRADCTAALVRMMEIREKEN